MTISFDHTIVPCRDKRAATAYLAEVLGTDAPREEGPFMALDLGNDVSLYFADWFDAVHPQHYCFHVSDAELEAVRARLVERGQTYWADPHTRLPGEVNHDDGGSGLYFKDLDDHFLEVITVRYGG